MPQISRHPLATPRVPRIAASIAALAAVVALVTACGASGSAATPTESPSASAAQLTALDQQAFVGFPESWEVLPAFDSVWASGFIGTMDDGTVTRIDPKTNEILASIKVSSGTDGLAASDEGVWVVDGAAHALRMIDPATNKLTDRKIPITDDGGKLVFANGSLWHFGWDALTRIDPATGKGEELTKLGACDGGCGWAITPDAIFRTKDGTLTRWDLAGTTLQATNATDVAGKAIGVSGDALYTGSSTGSVAILDPKTLTLRKAITAEPALAPDGGKWSLGNPDGGTIVADGTGAWVRFSSSVIGHVDPSGSIKLYGPFPSEADGTSPFTVADGSLWVTNEGAGSGGADGGKPGVYRVALPTP